jgi:hypothetical protein
VCALRKNQWSLTKAESAHRPAANLKEDYESSTVICGSAGRQPWVQAVLSFYAARHPFYFEKKVKTRQDYM